MTNNVGNFDRLLRVFLAAILGYLYYTGYFVGTLNYVALVAAILLLLTSLVGFCPLYKVLGINTCPVKK